MKNFLELCENEKDNIVAMRRMFHKHPEPYWREFWTTSEIVKYLRNLGLPVYMGKDIIDENLVMNYPSPEVIEDAKKFALEHGADLSYLKDSDGYTGAIAVLDTGRQGKTTVLRFDIDSNEVFESEDADHIPYTEGFNSLHKGCAHCCGHDGHISIGLTTAKILCQMKDELSGKIIFVFQPGEETVVGAKSLSTNHFFDNADYFLSAHIGIKADSFKKDMVGVTGFLSTKKINVEFVGKASHAGVSPEQGNNAILAACSAVTAMYTLCQDGRGSRRVNVGVINGGTGRNVVAPYASLVMEVRGETDDVCDDMYKDCCRVLEHAGAMFGVKVKINLVGEAKCGYSDSELTDMCADIIKKLYPDHEVLKNCNFGASEDVTTLMNRVRQEGGKSHFMMLGTELPAAHHNPRFDFNEAVLLKGVKIFVSAVMQLNS